MRKPVPGYRYFECENGECDFTWREHTRDCHSPSGEHCIVCGEFCIPVDNEDRMEWSTDKSGNLVAK